jgi:hypothetical protein
MWAIAGGDMPTNEKTIELRLEAVRTSLSRSRYAFFTSIIVSVALLIAGWNAYVSYQRNFVLQGLWYTTDATSRAASSDPTEYGARQATTEADRQAIGEWVRNQIISVSLLGIRISVYDAALLGGFSLLIVCIWLYFSMRAVNHNVGFLLCDTRDHATEIRDMIFHGIISNLLFTSICASDEPITNLHDYRKASHAPAMRTRKVFQFLFFLPSISIGVLVVLDVLSIFVFQAPYRLPHDPLIKHRFEIPIEHWVMMIAWDVIGLLVMAVTASVSKGALSFDKGMATLLHEYVSLKSEAATPNL